MKILYVEDNAVNLSLIQRIAQMNKHELISLDTAEGALKAIQEGLDIDIILLDIQLAGEMDGIGFAKALRTQGNPIPIIAITAYAMRGDKERILEAGCNDYLPKPLPIAEFLQLLAKYDPALKEAETASAPAPTTDTPESAPPQATKAEKPTEGTPAPASTSAQAPKADKPAEATPTSETKAEPAIDDKPAEAAATSDSAQTPQAKTEAETEPAQDDKSAEAPPKPHKSKDDSQTLRLENIAPDTMKDTAIGRKQEPETKPTADSTTEETPKKGPSAEEPKQEVSE